MRKKSLILISIFCGAFALNARAQGICAEIFRSGFEFGRTKKFENFTFNQNPDFIHRLAGVVAQSSYRSQVEIVPGFNDRIIDPTVGRLEKLIRQETPYTVNLMVSRLSILDKGLGFRHHGLVIGDPHFGNLNIQPILFQRGQKDRNRYSLVDVDEVGIGLFALDFARYVIFLKARFGYLPSEFGDSYHSELFAAYFEGLHQKSRPAPAFVSMRLAATSQDIRAKVEKYAAERADTSGKFRPEMFEKQELQEFKVKNMQPEFLASMEFDPTTGDRSAFKKNLQDFFSRSVKAEMGTRADVRDVAIVVRDSGGSASRQRFVVSVVVTVDGKSQNVILEFKENAPRNAWQAVIQTPNQTSAFRYELGLGAAMEEPGRFLKTVSLTPQTSFLMRARGNMDVKYETHDELREKSLYDAYVIGLFHGGQGDAVSGAYRRDVAARPEEFEELVMSVTNFVLPELITESGLAIPKPSR